jgi:hypothetical protein
MNLSNLYDYSDNSTTCKNCLIHILDYNFWISYLSINCHNLKFNLYSDEFLYLINYNYPSWSYYDFFVNHYNEIISQLNNGDIINYDTNVISLFTTFSRGSVHGYSGFYYTLITYLQNIESYKDLDIIIYEDCDSGMITIINHLIKLEIIKNKIIFLKKNVKYRFNSVTFIENKHHVFNGNLENMMTEFIQKYIIHNKSYENENEKCCILKTNINNNITSNGVLDEEIVTNFCNKYNIYRILPIDEIELINRIHRCKILILNYGSTFFKNYVYISDYCEKIFVVVNGEVYINDYNHLSSITPSKYQGIIYKKYKNAQVHYIINNNNLNFDPIPLPITTHKKTLIIISSKSPNNILLSCIDNLYRIQIRDDLDKYKVCVIDSDSDDFTVYDRIKEQFPYVDIHLVKNKNYEYGAWKKGLELYPDYDLYFCLQDSILLTKKINLNIINDNNCYIFYHSSGFNHHPSIKEMGIEILKQTTLNYESIIDSNFSLAYGNMFFVNNFIMKDIFNTLQTPPINKNGSCVYERIFGLYFISKKINSYDLTDYLFKINGKRI